MANPDLNVVSLKGKFLGCWCAPALCHGHILRDLYCEAVQAASQKAATVSKKSSRLCGRHCGFDWLVATSAGFGPHKPAEKKTKFLQATRP